MIGGWNGSLFFVGDMVHCDLRVKCMFFSEHMLFVGVLTVGEFPVYFVGTKRQILTEQDWIL